MTVVQAQEFSDENLPYQIGMQSGQIPDASVDNSLPAARSSRSVNERALRLDLRKKITGGYQHLRKIKDEIKKALGVESIRLLNEAGDLQLQVIAPFEPAVPLLELLTLIPNMPPTTAVLGFSESGSPVMHDFSDESEPNILISGQDNAGKTTLLRTIAASLAINCNQSQVQLVAINPVSANQQKQPDQDSSLLSLNYLPHMLTDVAVRQSEITELILFLVREMNFRSEHNFSAPRLVVLIDQAATVMEHGGRTIAKSLETLAKRGKAVGIHLVLSTSRPGADVFGSDFASNLQARFVGRRDSLGLAADQAELANGEVTTLLGEGDFLAANRSGRLRFQAAYIDDVDLHKYLYQVYHKRPILLAKPLGNQEKSGQEPSKSLAPSPQYSYDPELVTAN